MSEVQTLPAGGPSTTGPSPENVPDPSQFDAIVQAAFGDTARSSGSLESNASSSLSAEAPSSRSSSASTSQSVPSLTTSSTTASAASSKTPSPCPSILRANSAPPSAFPTLSSSTGSSPNVTFAPLPQTEPRKRNSSHPLGVAARSRLLRHRRMLRERGLNPDDYQYQYQYQYQHQHQYQYAYGPEGGGQGYPADTDADAHPHAYGEDGASVEFPDMDGAGADEEQVRMRRARTASDAREEEDPFVALGKLVKGAGKTLWKSLSMRDLRVKAKDKDKDKAETGTDGQPRTSEGEAAAGAEGGSVGEKEREKEKKAVPRRGVVGTGHLFDDDGATPRSRAEEEGGVWEEEVAEDSWKKLLSNPPPVSDTANANGDASSDGQATPTPASVEPAGPVVLTTIVVAQSSTTKAQ